MARPEFAPRLNLFCLTTDPHYVPSDGDACRALGLTLSGGQSPPPLAGAALPPVSDERLSAYGKRRVPDWLRAPRWFTKDSWPAELASRRPGDIANMVRQLAANHASAFRLSAYWGGQVYYQSRIAPHAPGLGRLDYLQEATEEGGRRGVRIVMYVNPNALCAGHLLYDEACVRGVDGRPLALAAYGTAGARYCCLENPRLRRFLLDVLAEAFARYPLAGVYVDGLTPQHCFCRWCREKYEKMWGEPMPVAKLAAEGPWCVLWEMTSGNDPLGDPADRQWQRYTRFRARALDDLTRQVCQAVRNARPEAATLFHSWPKPGCLDCYDGSLTEIYLGEPWRHKLWKPFELASYANSFPIPMLFNIYLHDFGTLAEARLKAAEGLASGCYPNFWSLAGMGPMFGFIQRNAEYLDFARTRPVPFLLFPRAIQVDAAMRRADRQSPPGCRFRPDRWLSPYVGFAGAMVCGGIPMVSVERESFHRKLGPYRVLALAGEACLSDEQAEAVRRFVAAGGGLVASGETSLFDQSGGRRADFALADVLGAHYQSCLPEGPRRLVPCGDHPLAQALSDAGPPECDEPCAKVRAIGRTVARFIPSPSGDERSTDGVPGVIVQRFGKGRVVYLPGRLDAVACVSPRPAIQRLLAAAVRWAAHGELPVEVRAPGPIAVSLFEQPDRWMVHLVNLCGDSQYRSSDTVVPVEPVRLELLTPWAGRPRRARRLWDARDLPLAVAGRRLSIEIGRLELYEVVAVEK
jgi:hypothetical protein